MAEFTPGSPDLSTPDLSDPRAVMAQLATMEQEKTLTIDFAMAIARELMKHSQNPALVKIVQGRMQCPLAPLCKMIRGELMGRAEKKDKEGRTSSAPYVADFPRPHETPSHILGTLGFQSASAARIILEN